MPPQVSKFFRKRARDEFVSLPFSLVLSGVLSLASWIFAYVQSIPFTYAIAAIVWTVAWTICGMRWLRDWMDERTPDYKLVTTSASVAFSKKEKGHEAVFAVQIKNSASFMISYIVDGLHGRINGLAVHDDPVSNAIEIAPGDNVTLWVDGTLLPDDTTSVEGELKFSLHYGRPGNEVFIDKHIWVFKNAFSGPGRFTKTTMNRSRIREVPA